MRIRIEFLDCPFCGKRMKIITNNGEATVDCYCKGELPGGKKKVGKVTWLRNPRVGGW